MPKITAVQGLDLSLEIWLFGNGLSTCLCLRDLCGILSVFKGRGGGIAVGRAWASFALRRFLELGKTVGHLVGDVHYAPVGIDQLHSEDGFPRYEDDSVLKPRE